MVIGVDFDNTIVCYDRLFHRVAVENALIPAAVPADKESVRNYLREQDRENTWTELQGLVYGVRIREAEPFPGVREFFAECRRRDIPICIVSHKTRLPVRGPQVDLHDAARGWLEYQGFHDRREIGLPRDRVFFAETKQGKLQQIRAQACSHYIDDLPEFLSEPDFPVGVERILFDPWERSMGRVPFKCVSNWETARRCLLAGELS